MPTALVTGARGFIGGHLVEGLLARGYHVRGLVRMISAPGILSQVDVELVEGDVTRRETLPRAVTGADVIFHLAGLTSALSIFDLMRANAQGAKNVARICAQQQTPPVHVVVSSVAAAGPATLSRPRTETDIPAPVSNYGRSKLAGELRVEEMAREVPTTIVRPGVVFGERNLEMLPMFRIIDRWGVHPLPGRHAPPLSVIYVKDLVDLLIAAAERGQRIKPFDDNPLQWHGHQTGVYFACTDQFPTYAEWGHMLGEALDRQPFVLPLVQPLPWLASGANEWVARLRRRPNSFNVDKIREATATSWACSPNMAVRDLGFSAHRPLRDQLRATVAWYREHGWLAPAG